MTVKDLRQILTIFLITSVSAVFHLVTHPGFINALLTFHTCKLANCTPTCTLKVRFSFLYKLHYLILH